MTQQSLLDDDDGDFDWKHFHNAMKAASQERRALNLDDSLRLLAEVGINFTSNNDGVHSVIVDHGATWDFWPSTGKWAKRAKQPKYQRGVFNLIRDINNARPEHALIEIPAAERTRGSAGQERPPADPEMA